MEHTRGNITRGGDLLIENVDVWVEKVQRGESYDWHGDFTLPRGQAIAVGGPYRLELVDGRALEIMVEDERISSGHETEVFFWGNGPLK